MLMKILIVSAYFHPQNTPRSFRTTELVKEFSKQGNDVTLYVPKVDEFHVPFEKEYGMTINDLGKASYRNVNIETGGKFYVLIKRALRRGLDYLFHYPNIEWMFKVKKSFAK